MNVSLGRRDPGTVQLVRVVPDPDAVARDVSRDNSVASRVRNWLAQRRGFVAIVIFPTFLAMMYYGLFAADRFETESRFVVRSPSAGATSQFASLVQGSNIVRSADDAFVVHAYVQSRDAARVLAAKAGLRDVLNRPEADFLWRYPGPFFAHNDERLWRHVQSLIAVDYDQTTGISTLRVQAFRAGDAKAIADALLLEAELLINRLSERAQKDAINSAEHELALSRARALQAHENLTAFRNRESIVDPTRVSTTALETMARLSLESAQTRAQLTEIQQLSPQSPQANSLKFRIAALDDQILIERKQLAGDDKSLAPLIAEYDRLVLERDFAERSLALAQNTLEVARVDALRQRLFLEHISSATAPDYAKYPRRILAVLAVFCVALILYVIADKLMVDTRAHAGR